MTINGPGPIVPPVHAPVVRAGPLGGREAATAPHAHSTPMNRPGGADPALWSLLTPDEQEFFAEHEALGPLTYGPRPTTSTTGDAPRGQRIDLRA